MFCFTSWTKFCSDKSVGGETNCDLAEDEKAVVVTVGECGVEIEEAVAEKVGENGRTGDLFLKANRDLPR